MKPHHVNSKQYMLSNNDILLVAAHDHPEAAEKAYKKAGSPAQATPELLMYTIFNQLFVQPDVIRLREGNTLATLTPDKNQEALFLMFDADTPNNTVNNIAQCFEASKKMGFKKLIGQSDKPIINKMVQRAVEKINGKHSLKIKDNSIVLEFANV